MEIDWGPKHNNTYNLHQLNPSHGYSLITMNQPILDSVSRKFDWVLSYSTLMSTNKSTGELTTPSIFLYLHQTDHDGKRSNGIQKESVFHPLDYGEKVKNNMINHLHYTSQHLGNLVAYVYMFISIFNMYYALFSYYHHVRELFKVHTLQFYDLHHIVHHTLLLTTWCVVV